MKRILFNLVAIMGIFSSLAQTELTDANADKKLLVNNDRLIVLDFYATWCGPCKIMEPVIKELEKEYTNVDFYKIDIDKSNIDEALDIYAIPTYLFIKNSSNMEQIEGAMSKEEMVSLIEKHIRSVPTSNTNNSDNEYPDTSLNHKESSEFSDASIEKIKNHWGSLNSLAWHAYKQHNDMPILLKAIDIANKSIEIDRNYYNVDTLAALLYKTGNYTKALKKAKEAIAIAKKTGIDYSFTSELIEKIMDKI